MSIDQLKQKQKIVFYQILSMGLGAFVVFLFTTITLLPKLILINQSLFNRLEVICGCGNHLSFVNHPYIFSFLIFTGLVLLTFFTFAIIKVLKVKKATSKFIRLALVAKKKNISSKLKKAVHSVDLENKIIEISDDKPVVFCYGFYKPKICISSKLVKELNKTELVTTLLHEKQHLLNKEPLKIFCVKTISKILFFIPILKTLTKEYLVFSEMTADGMATNNWQNKAPLAKVLYKIIKMKERSPLQQNLAISFFTTMDERINKLTNDSYAYKRNLWTGKTLLSMLLLILSVALFSGMIYFSKPVMAHNTEADACVVMSVSAVDECKMLVNQSECIMSYNVHNNYYCG